MEITGEKVVNDKRMFFPSFMGKIMNNIKIEEIPSTTTPGGILAAIVKNMENMKSYV